MMRYMWDEEAHQKFLRMKHPNYYAMDHEEHKRKFEEARDRAVREAVERALFRSRMTTTPDPVIKQETIDVECEVVSTKHTSDERGHTGDTILRGRNDHDGEAVRSGEDGSDDEGGDANNIQNTHDDQGTDTDSAQRSEGEGVLGSGT